MTKNNSHGHSLALFPKLFGYVATATLPHRCGKIPQRLCRPRLNFC
ncbi:MAG: hypothetical protein NC453_26590 [Muribaculum sp.]|nr:hypothetical protein [Muribaculum sp.]